MAIAPWLNVNPSDFVKAAEAGAHLGIQSAGIQERAEAARDRAQSALSAAASRAQAAQQIAHARMSEAAALAEANRKLREWETQQHIAMQQAQLERATEQGQSRLDQGLMRIGLEKAQREADLAKQGNLQDYRKGMMDIAQKRLDLESDKSKQSADAKAAGTVRIPLTTDKYALNPGYITLPANDPRAVAYFQGNTNVPPSLMTPSGAGAVGAGGSPGQNKVLRFNPETGDLE